VLRSSSAAPTIYLLKARACRAAARV
jgi:hypothetical protein